MKLVKILLGITMALVLVAVVAVVGFALFFDANEHKDFITARVQEETGRKLELSGDINLTYYPWLGLETNGITLANAEGFGEEPFVHADKVAIRIKTLPLLKQQYELDTFKLHGLRLNLVRNKDGRTNWEDLAGKPAKDKEDRQDRRSDPAQLGAVILGGVDVKDARITWQDETADQKVTVSNLNASTGPLTYGEPINLDVGLVAEANKPSLKTDMKLDGTLFYDLDAEVYSFKPIDLVASLSGKTVPGGSSDLVFKSGIETNLEEETAHISDLQLDFLGLSVRGDIAATDIKEPIPAANGQLSIKGEDLARLMRVFELKGAEGIAKYDDRSVDLQLKVNADTRTNVLSISELNAKMLGTVVNGKLDVEDFQSDKPSINTTLTASGSDLSRLLLLGGMTDLAKQLGGVADRSFDIKTDLRADLKKDTAEISNLDAKLLGAVIQGKVNAGNVTSGKPSAGGKLQANGPDLPALLQVAGQFAGKDSALSTYGQKLSKADNKAFDLTVDFDTNLEKGNVGISTLSARSLGLTVNGTLEGKNINSNKPDINGKLSIQGEKLSGVLTAVDQAGLAEVLQRVDLDAGLKSARGDIAVSPLHFKATLAGKDIPNSPVDLTLTGDASTNLDKQTLTVSALAIKGLGLDVTTSLQAENIKDAPQYQGDLKVAEFNLRTLAKQLNQALPTTADDKVLTKVGLATRFSGTTDSLKLSDLGIKLDESNLKGNVAVVGFAKPAIEFGFDIDNINADRYLPPQPKGEKKKAKPATPETAAGAAAAELPLDTLRSLNINGDLNIAKLVISNAKMSNVKVSIRAKDGDIRLDPVAADLYQGNYQALIALNAKGNVPALNVSNRITGVQLEPLLKDYLQQPESQLVGEANIVADNLTASGKDVLQLKQSLTGKVNLDVKQGILRGVDVRNILEQVEIMLESKRFGKIQQGGETQFERLSATLNADKGVINNNDLLMVAPGFEVKGQGMLANLNDETINYKLALDVVEESATRAEERYNIGGYQVPVYCRGTLQNLKSSCKPDVGEIAKVAVQKGALEAVGEKLGIDLSGSKKPAAPDDTGTGGDSGTGTDNATAPQKEDPTEKLKKDVGEALKGLFD